MVNDGLVVLLLALMLLLVMFLYAVITLSPEDAMRAEPPVLNPPAPPPPSPVGRWSQTPTVPAAGKPSHTAGPAWNSDAPVPAPYGVHRPKVSGRPPWEPAPQPLWEPAPRPPREPGPPPLPLQR